MKRGHFHVFTNLAISFDGKIATKDRGHIEPTPYDRYLMDVHRRRAHAVLVGAGTLRAYKKPALVERKRFQLWRKSRGLNPHPINAVIAKTIDFEPTWPFFTVPHLERVLVVPSSTSDSALKSFKSLAHVLKYDEKDRAEEQIIDFLKGLGCRNLLLEGGGGIMFPWAAKNLVDEWNVTVTPWIIGGESAPTMVEGEGFDVGHIKKYKLKRCFRRNGQVFLQYRK